MSYSPNQLQAFQRAVTTETKNKIDKIKDEIQSYETQQLAETQEQQQEKMFTYMQSRVQALKAHYHQEITKYQLQSHRELLLFRNELTEQVFQKAEQRLQKFIKSAEYPNFLKQGVTFALKQFPYEEQEVIVLLRKEDLAFFQQTDQQLPMKVQESERIELGGFVLYHEQSGTMYDCTLESALMNERKEFYRSCGLTVQL